MSGDDAGTPSPRARFAPNISTLRSLRERPLLEQRAVLEAWVAWLNSTGAAEPATIALRRRVENLIEQLDQDEKGTIDPAELDAWITEWLETAGQVGGPEREQDPLQPHPKSWHSNLASSRTRRRKR